MKLLPRIFWEQPGEKQKFQEIMDSDKSKISKISEISQTFKMSLTEAQEAISTFEQIKKSKK